MSEEKQISIVAQAKINIQRSRRDCLIREAEKLLKEKEELELNLRSVEENLSKIDRGEIPSYCRM